MWWSSFHVATEKFVDNAVSRSLLIHSKFRKASTNKSKFSVYNIQISQSYYGKYYFQQLTDRHRRSQHEARMWRTLEWMCCIGDWWKRDSVCGLVTHVHQVHTSDDTDIGLGMFNDRLTSRTINAPRLNAQARWGDHFFSFWPFSQRQLYIRPVWTNSASQFTGNRWGQI